MSIQDLSPPVFPLEWASEWGEDQFGLWMVLDINSIRYAFRWIEPGEFMMGSPKSEKGRYDWEDQHQVTLTQGFWMGETTVTQALWQTVMGSNPAGFKGANRPVESVSWNDVSDFIKKLETLHPALRIRLPWEAEWEYACRAGTQTPFSFEGELDLSKVNYSGKWDKIGEFNKGALEQTAKVRSYPANAWGLHEMHGNIWEWCEDLWQLNLGVKARTDPFFHSVGRAELSDENDGETSSRVLRGGSWFGRGHRARSAGRYGDTADYRYSGIGFRLVQVWELQQAEPNK